MTGKRHRTDEDAIAAEQETEDAALVEAEQGVDAEDPAPVPNGRAAELEAEVAELKDRLLRSIADMDNVRRRAARDSEDARKFGNERLLRDLLPILDNLELALNAAEQASDLQALKQGVELTHRLLHDTLGRHGLVKLEALGQPFDPNQHEAMAQVAAEDGQEPNQVIEELRPGYQLNERVLRPSLVKVTGG